MDLMSSITKILQTFGVTDTAITAMGPTLTIVLGLLAGICVGQLLKFPISKLLTPDWDGYVVRMSGVFSTFAFCHYLSDHLSVPMEVLTGIAEPTVYMLLLKAAERWAPWIANSFLATVGSTQETPK